MVRLRHLIGRARPVASAVSGRSPLRSNGLIKANPSRGGDAKPGISRETARLPAQECLSFIPERECVVKAKLARFTWALTMLAAMALSIGAGMRWD